MNTYRAVVALWSVLLLVSGVAPGSLPATTVVQGDVVHVWDGTPTRYVAKQIYEYPDTPQPPPPPPLQVHAAPVPIFEPHGTTGWVPLMPPAGWHLQGPVTNVPTTVQRPHYNPTTLAYPLEKPSRSLAQEPFLEERRKSEGPSGASGEATSLDDGQTHTTVADVAAPPAAERGMQASALAEGSGERFGERIDGTPMAESTDATFLAVTMTTQHTDGQSELTVTERVRGAATSEATATDATVMPTDVRTVVTMAGNEDGREYALASGAVAGIVVGAISLVALVTGLATYVILRRPFLKLLNGNDKSSAENVAYIDDSLRSGYVNAHVELPKESSEEMTSLDNDSFLNSLEAVTIQNYWADGGNTKNTIV